MAGNLSILRKAWMLAWVAAFSQTMAAQNEKTAFVDVHVLGMGSEQIHFSQTVIVEKQRIVEMGAAVETAVPDGTRVVEGQGRLYLMPGLADMHVHLDHEPETWLGLFLANGVTTVLNLRGGPRHLELRDQVAAGQVVGPNIYTSGPFTNLPTLVTPQDARKSVSEQKEAGYDLIKIHGNLRRETYKALIEAARSEGLSVTGHAPRNLPFFAVLEEGGQAIAHAEELIYTHFTDLDESRVPELAERFAAAELWLTPTLATFGNVVRQWGRPESVDQALQDPHAQYLHPDIIRYWRKGNPYTKRQGQATIERMHRFQFTLVKEFKKAGVRLLTGTDTPLPVMVAGFSLHDELKALVEAGLSPFQTLEAATRNAGDYISEIGREGIPFGRVEKGYRADLLLLSENPLQNLDALKRPSGVMVRGRWFSRQELDQMLTSMVETFVSMEISPTPAAGPSPVQVSPSLLRLYLGRYRSRGEDVELIVYLERTRLMVRLFTDQISETFSLEPVSNFRFRMRGVAGNAFLEFLLKAGKVEEVRAEKDGEPSFLLKRVVATGF